MIGILFLSQEATLCLLARPHTRTMRKILQDRQNNDLLEDLARSSYKNLLRASDKQFRTSSFGQAPLIHGIFKILMLRARTFQTKLEVKPSKRIDNAKLKTCKMARQIKDINTRTVARRPKLERFRRFLADTLLTCLRAGICKKNFGFSAILYLGWPLCP